LLMTLVIGLIGSVAGGGIASLLGTGDMWELNALGFIAAVVVAVLLLGAAESWAARR
jgi:uncharacterized membrane protein YeaQ/YmgE (transglycosylase-associated protein family)